MSFPELKTKKHPQKTRLCLGSSAPTPEECQQLVTPLSLADPSMLYGRMNFIMGYADDEVFKAILKLTDSSWIETMPSADGEVQMIERNKINGTCIRATVNVTISDNRGTTSLTNVTSSFHALPACDDCLVLSINCTVKNLLNLLKMMKIKPTAEADEVNAQVIYLFAKKETLKDSDLEQFKKQAACLGFSGDPNFHYDPKKGFCGEDEGVMMH
ncbi:uncharacterized protein ACBR49_017730 [Aulostomus maculatus]